MATNYFLLQTENTDPLVHTIDKLTLQIDANDKLITNLLETTDTLRFPDFTNDQWHPTKSEESFDELRYHLDTKYGLLEMPAPEFDTENPRIRQLLSDNYKLLMLYKQKQTFNQELAKILRKYQQVLMVELVPSLGRFNQAQTTETFKQFYQIADNKLNHDKLVYEHYVHYTYYLQRIYQVLHQLLDLLNMVDLDLPGVEAKLIALESLIDQVSSRSPGFS